MFSTEIAATTIVFIIAAIMYLYAIRSDLKRKNKNIELRLEELRIQYERVLCKEELEDILKSESLRNTLNDNSSTKHHNAITGLLVFFLLIVIYFGVKNSMGIEKAVLLIKIYFEIMKNYFLTLIASFVG